ncbi:DUF6768 family protein [Thalassotalea ganghwensis]
MQQAKQDLLVIAAQNGNEQAFAYLCKFYHQSLLRFAYKLSNDPQISQDAVQEAWIKLAKKLITLNDPRAFKSWIFKAVRWNVYDLIRKRARELEVVEFNNESDVPAPESTDNPKNDELVKLIDKLPELERQAIYLFYLEEMKIVEISEVLEVSQGTIKSRLNRARNQLREHSTKNMKEDKNMSIDAKIKKELASQASEIDRILASEDDGLKTLVESGFKGSMRRWFIVLNLVTLFITGALVWCGYQFFTVEQEQQLYWGICLIACIQFQVAAKQWLYNEMGRSSVIREIKRVELAVAELEERIQHQASKK